MNFTSSWCVMNIFQPFKTVRFTRGWRAHTETGSGWDSVPGTLRRTQRGTQGQPEGDKLQAQKLRDLNAAQEPGGPTQGA